MELALAEAVVRPTQTKADLIPVSSLMPQLRRQQQPLLQRPVVIKV